MQFKVAMDKQKTNTPEFDDLSSYERIAFKLEGIDRGAEINFIFARRRVYNEISRMCADANRKLTEKHASRLLACHSSQNSNFHVKHSIDVKH